MQNENCDNVYKKKKNKKWINVIKLFYSCSRNDEKHKRDNRNARFIGVDSEISFYNDS